VGSAVRAEILRVPAGPQLSGRHRRDLWTVAGTPTKRRWALDADLSAAFDRVGHDHILRQLGTFPARGRVRGWLKAGVLDKERFARPRRGPLKAG
jgi:RNA-directed DNA polymerase